MTLLWMVMPFWAAKFSVSPARNPLVIDTTAPARLPPLSTSASVAALRRTTGDTLNFAAQNGITIQSNVNGVLTLTGSSSIANYAAALQSITFSSSAGDPTNGGTDNSRTISWQVKDSSTTNGSSNVGQQTLSISAQPPSITGTTGVTATYFASGAAVALDGSVGVTDLASTTLSGATVSITGNFLLGDTLAVDTTGTNITALYNKVHGMLILSGSDTLAHYQTVLDRITYSSTALDPTAGTSANTRTISWQVNDGRATNNLSSVVTTSVDVTHIAPVARPKDRAMDAGQSDRWCWTARGGDRRR